MGQKPAYNAAEFPISPELQELMRGVTWQDHSDCPSFEDLRVLTILFYNFRGEVEEGRMIVHHLVSHEVQYLFWRMFEEEFPISCMRPMYEFKGNDEVSMKANNTSCFNFRQTINGGFSYHSKGLAVDINPLQNPMIVGGEIYPPRGKMFLNRSSGAPGMITRRNSIRLYFAAMEWTWGGFWKGVRDYHHFQREGLEL